MADVFISYARTDRERIEALAATLEAHGHAAWWDRQILGGDDFVANIERELDTARAVIVAWSSAGSASHWVRDEAQVAANAGKLVAISLDGSLPPMGFRQFHAIDFSHWQGQADDEALQALTRAVAARLDSGAPAISPLSPQAAPSRAAKSINRDDKGLRIAVVPIKARGNEPDLLDLAEDLASSIASGLSHFSWLNVTTQASVSEGKANGARYVLEGTLRKAGTSLRLATRLSATDTERQVWGENYKRAFDPDNVFDLHDDLTDHVVAALATVLARMSDRTPEGIVATEEASAAVDQPFSFSEPQPLDPGQLDLVRPQLTSLIGRREECALLDERLAAAIEGHGGIVLIGGEPGVGKTRLGEEAITRAHALGMLPLVGHAYEEQSAALITCTEILEEVARVLPDDNLRNVLGNTAPEIALLLPELRRRFPYLPPAMELPPEQQQRYLFNALLELTERLSRVAPLLMLLDDLQWADESSMLLLEHMAPHLPRLPVLMVITYRDVAADLGEPFKRALARMGRLDYVSKIALRRLGKDDVFTLLAELGGPQPPAALVGAIYEETRGNAFFVQSVYHHLADEGRLFDAHGHWRTDIEIDQLDVPEGVRLVIQRRLERMPEAAQAALRRASVMGLRFDLGILEATAGDGEETLDVIEAAETAGLVFPAAGGRSNRYEFSHALVRQTLLESVSVPRLQRLHLAMAEAMEQAWGDKPNAVAEIANHYYRAGAAADIGKTRDYLQRAAEQLLAAAAADESIIVFDRALELEDGMPNVQRAQLLHQRSLAHRTLGNWDAGARDRLAALPLFEAEGDTQAIARICWELSFERGWANDMAGGEALARRGLQGIPPGPSVERCQLMAALSMTAGNRMDFELWAGTIDEAIAMAEELGEARLLGAHILQCKCYLGEHWLKGQMHAEAADRGIAIVEELALPPWDLANILSAASIGYVANARFEDIDRLWQKIDRLGQESGDLGAICHARLTAAMVASARGQLAAAREFLHERLEWARETGFAWVQTILCMLACTEFLAGDRPAALRALREAQDEPIEGTMLGLEAATHMLLLAYGGEFEAAQQVLNDWRERLPIAGQENQIGAWWLGMTALEAQALMGQRQGAAALYPCARQLIDAGTHYVWPFGLTQNYAGIAAACADEWATAGAHFDQAVILGERVESPLLLAETARWRGQMHQWRGAEGDADKARQLWRQAGDSYAALGMGDHAALIERLLAGEPAVLSV